jgi:gas vesicle protein
MSKLFSFLSGALCGALIGSTLALLLAPSSGDELMSGARQRWEDALVEARQAMEDTEKELRAQFEQMKQGG